MAIGNMKIGVRLGLGFAALLAMQLVTTGLGMREMATLSDRVAFITDVGEAKLKALHSVEANVGARAIAARNLVLVTDAAAQQPEIDRVKAAQAGIDKGMEELAGFMKNPATASAEERKMFEQLRRSMSGRSVGGGPPDVFPRCPQSL